MVINDKNTDELLDEEYESKVFTYEPVSFRFKGKVARLLGRESVSDAVIALSELVKNSYDADAKKVVVYFKNVTKKNAEIVIKDDGIGMTYDEFKSRWMVVGTSFKEENRISHNGRRMIGEKGIGRFAVERLSDKLDIITTTTNMNHYIKIRINWSNYEKENSYFDSIENEVTTLKKEKKGDHGFTLVLTNLRDVWTFNKLLDFRKQMTMLVPPEIIDSKLFSIQVKTPDYPGISGKINNIIFKEAYYVIDSKINNDGNINCQIKDRHNKVSDHTAKIEKYESGPLQFTLYFYPRGLSKDEKPNYRALKLNDVRELLNNFAGIRIYRDGFRVKPYGDPGDDWLNLNYKRLYAGRYLYPDNRQIIGILKISRDENKYLIDTTTREGLIKNNSFNNMVEFINKSIEFLSNRRREDRAEKIIPKTIIEEKITNISDAILKSNININKKNEIMKDVVSIEETALDLVMIYRNLASIGITVIAVAHEITNPISTIVVLSDTISQELKEKEVDIKSIEKASHLVKNNIMRIHEFINFIEAYHRKKRRQRLKVDLSEIVNGVFEGYNAIFNKRKIKIDLIIEDNIEKLNVYRGDFESLFINLITNSLEAIKRKKGNIKVTIKNDDGYLFIKFSDNGMGIPINNRQMIFEPFFTTKEDGMGMGLTIVKEIVEEYDGSIETIESELENGATFIIRIPIKELK